MRSLLLAVSAIGLVACASTPSAPSSDPAKVATVDKLILGKWNCSTSAEGQTINAVLDYTPGKASYDMSMTGEQGGMSIAVTGAGEASWEIQPDGKIKETITSFKVASGKMGGNDVPPAMIQSMVESMLVNQSSISTVTISGATMTMVDADGITTNCKR